MHERLMLSFLLVLLAIPGGFVHAQLISQPEENRIFISMTPQSPSRGEYVALSAASTMIDLKRSDIVWYADKKIIAEGRGMTEVTALAGELGSETDVVVIAQSPDGTSATGEVFIRPAEIDLLWESDSYTPPFYKGRALPSAGTTLRVQAIARLVQPEGALVPESDITYTWRRNGSVVATASGKGRSVAVLPAPTLFGKDLISVEAVSEDGALRGEARVAVPSVEPDIELYEDHPLFGILYHRTFGGSSSVAESEMTFSAVPYFAHASGPDDPLLAYKWQVNGQTIAADYAKPSEIVISAGNSDGNADISLSVTRARDWFMKATGAWKVMFAPGGSTGPNPFTGTTNNIQ